jgi:hypothetical protein
MTPTVGPGLPYVDIGSRYADMLISDIMLYFPDAVSRLFGMCLDVSSLAGTLWLVDVSSIICGSRIWLCHLYICDAYRIICPLLVLLLFRCVSVTLR